MSSLPSSIIDIPIQGQDFRIELLDSLLSVFVRYSFYSSLKARLGNGKGCIGMERNWIWDGHRYIDRRVNTAGLGPKSSSVIPTAVLKIVMRIES